MPQCSRCRHISGKDQTKKLSAAGLFRCALLPVWIFRSPTKPHDCAKYAEVPTEDMPARLAFEKAKQ
jgi:hypothetical protein